MPELDAVWIWRRATSKRTTKWCFQVAASKRRNRHLMFKRSGCETQWSKIAAHRPENITRDRSISRLLTDV
ncbi:MAG: hypothetical protein AAGL96_11690 [Pseudomonadota bacterium]